MEKKKKSKLFPCLLLFLCAFILPKKNMGECEMWEIVGLFHKNLHPLIKNKYIFYEARRKIIKHMNILTTIYFALIVNYFYLSISPHHTKKGVLVKKLYLYHLTASVSLPLFSRSLLFIFISPSFSHLPLPLSPFTD